jgi:biotin carboxyl carrier protein
VIVVEAMKMEHTLRAAFDGIVTELRAAVGDRVALNQQLAVIEPIDDASNNESTGDR